MVSWFRVAACAGALTMVGFVGSAAACVHRHYETPRDGSAHPGYQVSARLLELRPGSLRKFRADIRPHHGRTTPRPPSTTAPGGAPTGSTVPSGPAGTSLRQTAGPTATLDQPANRRQ